MLQIELRVHLDDRLDDGRTIVSGIRTLVEHHYSERGWVSLGIDGRKQPAVHRRGESSWRHSVRSIGICLSATAVEVEPDIVVGTFINRLGKVHHCTKSILSVFVRWNSRVRSSVNLCTVC